MGVSEHLHHLERKVSVLEGRVAFHRSATVVMLLVACVLAIGSRVSAKTSEALDTVRAQEFVLVDNSGRVRGTFGVSVFGPTLKLKDKNGRTRIELGIVEGDLETVSVSLWDKQRNLRAVLGSIFLSGDDPDVLEYRAESSLVLLSANGDVLWRHPPRGGSPSAE